MNKKTNEHQNEDSRLSAMLAIGSFLLLALVLGIAAAIYLRNRGGGYAFSLFQGSGFGVYSAWFIFRGVHLAKCLARKSYKKISK